MYRKILIFLTLLWVSGPALGSQIVVQEASDSWTATLSEPADLVTASLKVGPYIFTEYISDSKIMTLTEPTALMTASEKVRPRIVVEYASNLFQAGLSNPFGASPPPEEVDPPTNLEALSGTKSIRLSWNPSPSPNLAGYNVYRSTSQSGGYSKINTSPVVGDVYTDESGLITGTPYYYYLKSQSLSGIESDPSNTASAEYGMIKLFIPDARGDTGSQVRLPINIANADGLDMCAVDIYVTYDSTVLTATGIERTALTTDYTWDSNIENPGVARAAIASGSGDTLYGDGSLFFLLFDVTGGQSDTSPLDFQVEGTSIYDCDNLMEAISIDVSDSGVFTVDNTYVLGDINGDGSVNSADVALALKISVGLLLPTGNQISGGDASGDGEIHANDAAIIIRLALDMPLAPIELRKIRYTSNPVKLSVAGNYMAEPNNSVWAPIEIDDAADLRGAEIVLNYDPAILIASGVRKTTMSNTCNLESNLAQAGQVKIAIDGSFDTSAAPGAIVEVQFTVQSDAANGSVSPLNLVSARLNDEYGRDFKTSALQRNVVITNGNFTVGSPSTGNLNHSGGIDIGDVISALRMLANIDNSVVYADSDVNGDSKIGLDEVIYVMQIVAEIRH